MLITIIQVQGAGRRGIKAKRKHVEKDFKFTEKVCLTH